MCSQIAFSCQKLGKKKAVLLMEVLGLSVAMAGVEQVSRLGGIR